MGLSRFLTVVLAGTLAVAASAATRQAGGTYVMQLSTTEAAFPITSLDFGETSVASGAVAGKAKLSPVVVTLSAGGPQVAELARACVANQHLQMVTASYVSSGATQFQVKFQNAMVASIQFPTVDKSTTAPGDVTVTLSVQSETIQQPAPPVLPNERNNQLKIVTKTTLPVIPRKWQAPGPIRLLPPSGNFSLTLAGIDTSGVLTTGPLSLTEPIDPSTGMATGKLQYSPLGLTVDATKAADFTNWNSKASTVQNGTLVLNRRNAAGAAVPVTFIFKGLKITSYAVSGQAGSTPTIQVQVNFEGIAVVSPSS